MAFFGGIVTTTQRRLDCRSRYPSAPSRLHTTGQRLQRGLSLQHFFFVLTIVAMRRRIVTQTRR